MTTDELRAKFEAWWKENYWYVDENLSSLKHYAWMGWLAAHASRDAEVEALRKDAERYRKLLDLLDEAESVSNEASTIRNIVDDAINLGSGFMNLHLDAAMREESK